MLQGHKKLQSVSQSAIRVFTVTDEFILRYLIDSRWFKQWKKYVGFDSWDMYNVGERSLYPGPIDNSGLFSGKETILITLRTSQILDIE